MWSCGRKEEMIRTLVLQFSRLEAKVLLSRVSGGFHDSIFVDMNE